jgi:hypothetical protein
MQLHCRSCGKPIPAEDVNISLALAKCGVCHAVFNFAGDVGGEARNWRDKTEVPMPKAFRVENWGSELAIHRRWYSHALWFLLFFCIVWDGFLVVWYSIGVGGLLSGEMGGMVWIMLLFPILHVAVGVGLTYFVLCGFFNTTTIRVAGGELSVRHGPFPWYGNHRLFSSEVNQLYCTEKEHRGKHGRRSYTYNVALKTHAGDKVDLVTHLEELDHALFIEQQLERHLQIRDERVPGEVRA